MTGVEKRIYYLDSEHIWIDGRQYIDIIRVGQLIQEAKKEKNKSQCRYCNRKPEFDKSGSFYEWDNEEEIAHGPWTIMYAGVDEKGRVILTASGDGRAVYYPKYCPECGRKLEES